MLSELPSRADLAGSSRSVAAPERLSSSEPVFVSKSQFTHGFWASLANRSKARQSMLGTM
jgi:hypothetical protein